MLHRLRTICLIAVLVSGSSMVRSQPWVVSDALVECCRELSPAAPEVHAAPFDADGAALDDARREREGLLPLYARFTTVGVDLYSAGAWSISGSGDRIWRLQLASSGALAVEVFMEEVHLPPGAMIHVYDPAGGQVQGGYGAEHVSPDGQLSSMPVFGDRLVITYFEPRAVAGQGYFRITDLAHTYRFLDEVRTGACQVDVACSEGSAWTEQRDAVVRIRVVIPSGAGFCTGTLMNNTAQDCSPYILTAFHCGEESVAANFSQYQFLFNYQRSCGSGSAPAAQLITGCQRMADSNDSGPEGGGTYGSDFMLLRLNSVVPASYNAYYAGWEATVFVPSSGVCIHHAAGDHKKISTYTSALTDASWAGFTVGSHWRVTWTATANGHGVTEPGSSGAPLFNAAKRVIGTLTGGSSCCVSNGCGPQTGLNQPDYFGKISYHWNENPNPPEEKLRLFLSPTGNVVTLNGSYAPCGAISVPELNASQEPAIRVEQDGDRLMVYGTDPYARAMLLRVTDATGRVVYEGRMHGDVHVIPMSDRPNGIYLISALTASGQQVQRSHFVR